MARGLQKMKRKYLTAPLIQMIYRHIFYQKQTNGKNVAIFRPSHGNAEVACIRVYTTAL